MAWLVRDGDVLASLDQTTSVRDRMVGLLGRDGIEGALLLRPARSVHTLGMRFAIDVAFLDRQGTVVAVVAPMRRWRLGRMRLRARQVLEAEAGSFERWKLAVGDVLEIV